MQTPKRGRRGEGWGWITRNHTKNPRSLYLRDTNAQIWRFWRLLLARMREFEVKRRRGTLTGKWTSKAAETSWRSAEIHLLPRIPSPGRVAQSALLSFLCLSGFRTAARLLRTQLRGEATHWIPAWGQMTGKQQHGYREQHLALPCWGKEPKDFFSLLCSSADEKSSVNWCQE